MNSVHHQDRNSSAGIVSHRDVLHQPVQTHLWSVSSSGMHQLQWHSCVSSCPSAVSSETVPETKPPRSAGSSFGDSRHGALSPEASDTTPSGGKNLSPALARALAKKAKAAGQSPARLAPGEGGAPSPGALVNQSPRTPVSTAVDQQNAHHGRAAPLDEEEDLEV